MSSRSNSRPTNQPETAEYIEKLIPESIDDPITYSASIEFRFRQHKDVRGYVYSIPGVKTDKQTSYFIESNYNLPFKAGDIIRFGRSDNMRYEIKSISFTSDKTKNYRRAHLYPNDTKSTQYKVIELV
jgi:hypothetical protein